MVDAGIVDGDFVVVRQQPDAQQGDIVVAGIPDEEATVKTFSHPGREGRAHAGQRPARADGVRPVRGHRLRQGRHRAAPPLTPLRPAADRAVAGSAPPPAQASGCRRADGAHVRVAVAGGGVGREDLLDGGQVGGVQHHVGGRHVLLEVGPALGPRDRHHVVAPCEHPGQRQLARRAALGRRQLPDASRPGPGCGRSCPR